MRFKRTEQDWLNVLNSEIWELEEVEKGLFPPLLLSYYDLPSALKRCFSFCAIFPKYYEIEPDKLIQLWMAHGYLSSRRNVGMELVGREYFENLVMWSFFQNFEIGKDDGRIKRCKMHDIVHDFAQFLTKNECFIMEVGGGKEPSANSSNRKGRHSTIIFEIEYPFPISISNRENLHTLFVMGKVSRGIHTVLPDLFCQLKYLRALDLSHNSIEELPKEVGYLMYLRYLNLSFKKFKKLPKTVCDLCNLQTLDLYHCDHLKELPKGMGKLISLRYLEMGMTSALSFMPKGIGRLISLRMLTKFIVSGGDDSEACKVGDLENLNNLEHLEIEGLGNVANVGAKGKMDNVLEALQPHPNLESLVIWKYIGTLFPNWMMSSIKLRKLVLYQSINSEHLPPLGKLQSLESLQISCTDNVKKVGVEFLGIEIDGNELIAFPKLKHLTFYQMGEWEEWDVMITRRLKEEEKIMIMPCLCSLTIKYCRKLKALPQHLRTTQLEELKIIGCPILKQRCQKGIGEDWPKISHIPSIKFEY